MAASTFPAACCYGTNPFKSHFLNPRTPVFSWWVCRPAKLHWTWGSGLQAAGLVQFCSKCPSSSLVQWLPGVIVRKINERSTGGPMETHDASRVTGVYPNATNSCSRAPWHMHKDVHMCPICKNNNKKTMIMDIPVLCLIPDFETVSWLSGRVALDQDRVTWSC